MAVIQASTESELVPTCVADPYDWTPDQVTHCLCSPEGLILRSNIHLPLPDPDGFANILRKEWIDGEALLTLVTKSILHDDWGLAYGLCAKILNLIRRLQQQSFKYREMRKEIIANDQSLFERTVQTSHHSTPCATSPEHYDPKIDSPLPNLPSVYLQTMNMYEESPVLPQVLPSAVGTHQTVDFPLESHHEATGLDEAESARHAAQIQEETTVIDHNGRKRRRLMLGSTLTAPAPNPTRPAVNAQGGSFQELTHKEGSGCMEPSQEIRDRDLVSDPTAQCFLDPMDSSEILSNDVATSQVIQDIMTDTIAEADRAQRKRIQPTLVAQPDEGLNQEETCANAIHSPDLKVAPNGPGKNSVFKQSPLGKRAKRTIDQIYYGPSGLHVDDIFYWDTVLGGALNDETLDFSAEKQGLYFNSLGGKSDAQRLWVNSRIKFFFRSTTTDLVVREGGKEAGIIPYPDRLGKRNTPLSMTLLSRHQRGIWAKRLNRSDWTTANIPTISATEASALDAFKVRDPLMAVDDRSIHWDSLWKWNHRDDDEVLPLYGHSGSEGEYDLETWREIETESGKTMKPVGHSQKSILSSNEVGEVVDTGIQQLRKEWHIKQKPKMRHQAWRYWVKAHRDHTSVIKKVQLEKRWKALETRILGLRQEICGEEWTKFDAVLKQSKITQPSVFDQEECQWRIGVLQSKQAPEKATARRQKLRMDRIEESSLQDYGEDCTSSESAAADEETDEEMDGFIVNDDLAEMNENQIGSYYEDATMADFEDAVESDTVVEPSHEQSNAPLSPTVHGNIEMNSGPESPKISQLSCQQRVPPSFESKTSADMNPTSAEHPQSGSTRNECFIDLTQDTSSLPSPLMKPEPGRILTPPIINSEEDSEAWFQRSRGKKPIFKHPPCLGATPVVNLDTDSDSPILVRAPTELPALNDVKRIQTLSPTKLVEKQDRKRLLVWLIAHIHGDKCQRIINYVDSLGMESCFAEVTTGLKKMKAGKLVLRGKKQETSDCILQVAAWYIEWTIPVKLDSQGVSIAHIRTTLENEEGFEAFYDFMIKCLRHYKKELNPSRERGFGTPSKKRSSSKISDPSSPKTNVRVLASESQETLQKRDTALQRMRDDNYRVQLRAQKKARQMELLARFPTISSQQAGHLEESGVVLNPGKRDEEDFIRLNPGFGRGTHLKPHQVEGLQFMWREITGDHNDLQGCLLAQTMGLGKTVQVIALLIALSEAANSSNNAVCEQIPVQLRDSQTLILCPPGLIENWWDECLLWPPESNHLGEIRKVSAVMKLNERIREILVWEEEGGVLLMGYSTFRDLLSNKSKPSKANKATTTVVSNLLTDEQHQHVMIALLKKPNIVVADEAHEFKSQNSNINRFINQITCKSRIALTGSPLSNNLGEYFSMIDWIAPGYLGTYNDFKNVYEDPIQDGLYQDQEPALYRESRKRLKALELELEPKIHRADPSALHNSLSGKSEFVISVPLTTIQERLYRCFVSIISGVNSYTEGKVREAKLWSYLSRLQLLCNHPALFYNNLVEEYGRLTDQSKPKLLQNGVQKRHDAMKIRRHSEDVSNISLNTDPLLSSNVNSDEDPEPLPESVLSVALREMRQAINELDEDVSVPHLSNKMRALVRITELSTMVGDKVLIFSHRLDTLNYIGNHLKHRSIEFCRIDGNTASQKRQEITKSFNEGPNAICLISTKAGGQGLNMFGANRVVLLDSHFNPMWEQQAVGRAYRIGQKKHVYVYRLIVAGTFEDEMQNQALFKEQLATRVLEKKNPDRIGLKGTKKYIFVPKQVEYSDVKTFLGKDTEVLDHLLTDQERTRIVSVTPSETFYVDDGHDLTAQERKEAEQLLKDEQLRRRNPAQYQAMLSKRSRLSTNDIVSLNQLSASPCATAPAQSPSSHLNDATAQLAASIDTLFPSGPLISTRRERASDELRSMVKSAIHELVFVKGGPHPSSTANQIRVLIDQHAKDEHDYLRLWEGIKTLLKKPDTYPDAVLHVMVAKLGEPRPPKSKKDNERSGSIATDASSSLQIEKITNLASSEGDALLSIQSAVSSDVTSASDAALVLTSPLTSEPDNSAGIQAGTGIDRPFEKQQPANMNTNAVASIGATEKQFDNFLRAEG